MRKPIGYVATAAMVAGAFYLAQNFKVRGLDALRPDSKPTSTVSAPSDGAIPGSLSQNFPANLPSGADYPLGSATAAPATNIPGTNIPGTTIPGATVSGAAATSAARSAGYPRPINSPLPQQRSAETIRVASFNIQVFGESKIAKPEMANALVAIMSQFDIIAIQEIRTKSDDLLPRFVELINARGGQYDFVIGPRLGRSNSKEQYAFVYDRRTVEIDRRQMYTVSDPDDLLHREPLVAWFRTRNAPPQQAFTFTLVNIHTDPDDVKNEMNAMGDVFMAVRDDGRGEDDVIVLGDINANDFQLGRLGQLPNNYAAISRTPTNTRGNAQFDNLIFDHTATREFTARSGVFDYLREFNLTMEQALEISDHLPIWAEFSIYEGGYPGRFASPSVPPTESRDRY
ncbi:MAG: endonuclease/exonuclease/phosphatase family protein [Planctomycetota bacterium]